MKSKLKIALIGIDGSGKTSLIEGLGKKLDKDGIKHKTIYMGLGSNHQIPLLGKMMSAYAWLKYGEDTRKEDYHQSRDNLRERGPLWVLVQYVEFWVRYVKARRLSKENIIFFDRFFYDGLILGSEFSFNIFKFFTPVPDKSFLIKASPEVIRKRKDEASVENIKKYYKKSERVLKYFPITIIDNTKSISKVVNEIYNHIFENEIKQRELFEFLNKNRIKYVVLRGHKESDFDKEKDLDILIDKEDYDSLKNKKLPKISQEVHFYPGEEKHFGITFLNSNAISQRKFDSEKGFFVLSQRDKFRMIFFRSFIKLGRIIKRVLGFYEK